MLIILAGCRPKPEGASHSWLIQGYDKGVITAQHDGRTYTATCDTSRSFNNARSITDVKNVIVFPSCDLAVGLVGAGVQPLGGQRRDPDGSITVMWSFDATLAIRRTHGETTPWRQDEFRITSVVASK
jgi:hypothetical protein